ncbi:MarR family winged helix-turn-helix transcriptional regulator [Ilumatobacter nonamiensis]|uniref:MarR family winged helix-turn-helix transcriptional regulator n=1 Tax=Ilumatobacter nonamiensis TaxID=467093 RepID=UPI000349E983|nr:MarR family transcriptional regulator [Ilumatobacter nonamiensis]
MDADAIARIEAALITLVRRANDPRGNRVINRTAGVDIDRAASVMLARVEELEPARLSELAGAAGVDTSTASRQVARLVDDGLVVRACDPTDGRATAHRLSDMGRATRRKLDSARRSWFEDVLAGHGEAEREQLAVLLERFIENIPNDA